jgi:hypothetical protein
MTKHFFDLGEYMNRIADYAGAVWGIPNDDISIRYPSKLAEYTDEEREALK